MSRLILILLILSILGVNVDGQDIAKKGIKSLFITGITYDSETLESLSGTNFKINSQNNFATDPSGRFSLYGAPGDTIVFTYMGYQPSMLIVPDTLTSQEYVVGVFMHEQSVKLAEIIILSRLAPTSIIITPVPNDRKTMEIAQSNVDKAPKVYDADMNAKKALRTNQLRTEYRGMLVTPENAVGLSTLNYPTNNIIYGSPITTPNKVAREIVTDSEIGILLGNFKARKKGIR
jgi:hypothetical protein